MKMLSETVQSQDRREAHSDVRWRDDTIEHFEKSIDNAFANMDAKEADDAAHGLAEWQDFKQEITHKLDANMTEFGNMQKVVTAAASTSNLVAPSWHSKRLQSLPRCR